MYTKFCKVNFYNKSPYPNRLLFVDESLYRWRILESHSAACFYTNRKDEALANYEELTNVLKTNPELFSQEDISKILSNAQFFR